MACMYVVQTKIRDKFDEMARNKTRRHFESFDKSPTDEEFEELYEEFRVELKLAEENEGKVWLEGCFIPIVVLIVICLIVIFLWRYGVLSIFF